MTIDYVESSGFVKDFKRLNRKFASLPEDFDLAKKAALELYHIHGIDAQSVFEIPHIKGGIQVYKLRKFACKSLKGRGSQSGIRIIYAWLPDKNEIHFIEMYHKSDQKNQDRKKILSFLKGLKV